MCLKHAKLSSQFLKSVDMNTLCLQMEHDLPQLVVSHIPFSPTLTFNHGVVV